MIRYHAAINCTPTEPTMTTLTDLTLIALAVFGPFAYVMHAIGI